MAAGDDAGAVAALGGSDKATETLSQFVARVLDQLSLSAWLPSAAMVLLLAFVVRLGDVLDRPLQPPAGSAAGSAPGPVAAVGQALAAVGGTGLGGALLLVVAVVVLTMVTQAFAFEAIRTLEGYWGTGRSAERLAGRRCARHRAVRRALEGRLGGLTADAWAGAQRAIQSAQEGLAERGLPVEYTPDMLSVLGASVTGVRPTVKLDEQQRRAIRALDWQRHAPAEVMRRRLNVDKRLRDYPEPHRMLPTRLGNILRRHEDATGRASVETLVQEVFDELPPSLRAEHDEQRTRLDLYCSMVFVVVAVTVLAVARFAAGHWPYAAGAALTGWAAAYLMYRAAVASARAYGRLLLLVAARVPRTGPSA